MKFKIRKKIAAVVSVAMLTGVFYAKISQQPVMSNPSIVAQSTDEQYLKEVNTLLRGNREIARKIATKMGIESSSTTPGTGNLAEQTMH